MVRKVKKKKSGIRIFMTFLLMVVFAALGYITLGNHHIFERETFTSSRHSTPPTNKHPGGITFNSTMFEELNNQNIIDGEILGGKTGYTDKAGLCLASLAKVGKQEYILITAGAKGNHKSEQYNFTDALAVYNSLGKE